jgi:uncharacterized cupredoxin-like copper-binding protein
MAAYFVLGGLLVAWALVLSFGGMARGKDFPDRSTGRTIMAVSAGLCIAVFGTLLVTTDKEHPREEAAEHAAENETKEQRAAEAPAAIAARKLAVSEDEYAVKLAGGTALEAGGVIFNVANTGKVPHDLAIEGGGVEKKTPLIDPGKTATLAADLKPGKYKFYCTVPGHEQLGMKTEVTVR